MPECQSKSVISVIIMIDVNHDMINVAMEIGNSEKDNQNIWIAITYYRAVVFQPGVISSPRGHLAISGDIFDYYNCYLVVRDQKCC